MGGSYPSSSGAAPATHEVRIAVIAADADRRAALLALLSVLVPDARIEALDAHAVTHRPSPEATVIDVAGATPDVVQLLRASGYEGAIVCVRGEAAQSARLADAERLGAVECAEGPELGSRLASALAEAGAEHAGLRDVVRDTRRLLAAGLVARRLQHAINNPLAALLAEAQLLEMEELSDEQRSAVQRMVELCRRVNGLVRELDGPASGRTG